MMRPGGMGLRARLIALLLATLIPLVGLGGYWILFEFREERARIRHEVQATAERVAAEVGHSVAGVHERLAVLARLPAVRTGNRQEIERLFQNLLADAPHLQNLGLVAPDGTIMASAVPLPPGRPVSLGDREWLQRVVRGGEPAVGGFQVGRITGNPNVILAYPVLDEQGRLTAVIYAALDLVYASRAVTGAYSGVPLLWAVVDEQGLVLLHSRPETTSGKPLGPLPGMLRGETIVSGTRWHSVVGMPQDLVTARVRETFLRIGLPAGLILLISAAVGLWIAYSTWRPIRDLTAAVRRVGAGDPTVQVPVQVGGEVGELAATFAETLTAVDRRRGELAALLEAGRAIASSLDLEQSLQAIVRQATIISGTKVVRLLLLEGDGKQLRSRVGVGLPMEEERELVIPVGESFSGQVVATGKPLAVADTRDDQRLRYPLHTTRHGLISYLGLPVKLGDRILGVLVFNTTSPRTYSHDEIAYLSAFAAQAAIAIENARLHGEALEKSERLEALTRMGAKVAGTLRLQEVLDTIVEEAAKLLRLEGAGLRLLEGDRLIMAARYGLAHYTTLTPSLRIGESLAGLVAQQGRPLMVPDQREDSQILVEHRTAAAAHGAVAYLGVPVRYRDRIIGVLHVDGKERRTFSEEEIRLLSAFADHAAIAIENARLHEATRRAAREARSLYEVAHSLTTLLDPREVLHLISVKTTELLGTPHAQVVLWDEDTKTLRFGAAYGTEAEKVKQQVFRLGEGVNGIVAETRKPLLVNDYQRFPKRRPNMTDLVAVIGVPLLYRGRLLGVLTSHATQAGTIFTEDHLALLTSFANQAAIAIENARLYDALRRTSEELELRVEARTRELREAHEELVRRERLALVGQLAGGVGHELRNPLGVIGNAVYYLRMRLGGGDMKVQKHLAILETEVRRANKIVTDLLDFSRVKQPSRAPAQLNAIIRDILARQPQPSSVKLELDLIESLPPILVDPDQVGQVFLNLVINAIEAMPDGGSLTIRTRSTSDAVVASVSDTGVGIPPENLEKIFQPLFTTKTKGIGLGLAVSRQLIDANGGALSVESQIGKGSTFTAIFPIEGSESVDHG